MPRDRVEFPSVADSDLAVTGAVSDPHTTLFTDNPVPGAGFPYPIFTPDYRAKPFAGMRRFFRFNQQPETERYSPSELQVLKIGLQNPLGNNYTATPLGRTVPMTYFAPNPAGMRYRERSGGIAAPEPPEINQGGNRAYLDVVSSIVRRR